VLFDNVKKGICEEKFLQIPNSQEGQTNNPSLYNNFLNDNDERTCSLKIIGPNIHHCQPCNVYF
jgi:hypothetical protein